MLQRIRKAWESPSDVPAAVAGQRSLNPAQETYVVGMMKRHSRPRSSAWPAQYGRYGYRRITALLRTEGWHVNAKRVARRNLVAGQGHEGPTMPRHYRNVCRRLWLNDGSLHPSAADAGPILQSHGPIDFVDAIRTQRWRGSFRDGSYQRDRVSSGACSRAVHKAVVRRAKIELGQCISSAMSDRALRPTWPAMDHIRERDTLDSDVYRSCRPRLARQDRRSYRAPLKILLFRASSI